MRNNGVSLARLCLLTATLQVELLGLSHVNFTPLPKASVPKQCVLVLS